MPDEIDYQGIASQLQYENERLRKRLWEAHARPLSWTQRIANMNTSALKKFILENYLLIIIALTILSFAQGYIEMFIRLFTGSKGKHLEK